MPLCSQTSGAMDGFEPISEIEPEGVLLELLLYSMLLSCFFAIYPSILCLLREPYRIDRLALPALDLLDRIFGTSVVDDLWIGGWSFLCEWRIDSIRSTGFETV